MAMAQAGMMSEDAPEPHHVDDLLALLGMEEELPASEIDYDEDPSGLATVTDMAAFVAGVNARMGGEG